MSDLPQQPQARSRALGLFIAGLTLALLVGGYFVIRNLASSSMPSAQAPTTGPGASDVDAAITKAQAFQRAGNHVEAGKLLADLVARRPDDQSLRVVYAQALLGQQQPKLAYEQFEAAIALAAPPSPSTQPGTPSAAGPRDAAAAQLHFEAGTCAVQAQLPARAIEHYTMAQTLNAGEARYPLYLGMVQARTGDDPAAVASLLRAAKLKPDLPESWGTLAEIELRRNNTKLALQHVERARTLQPDAVRWRLVQARAFNRTGDADKALALLSALDPRARADKTVLSLMAETYGLLRRPVDAADMYAAAATAAPSDSELNYQAAVWARRIDRHDQAKRFAEIASALGHAQAKELASELSDARATP